MRAIEQGILLDNLYSARQHQIMAAGLTAGLIRIAGYKRMTLEKFIRSQRGDGLGLCRVEL